MTFYLILWEKNYDILSNFVEKNYDILSNFVEKFDINLTFCYS